MIKNSKKKTKDVTRINTERVNRKRMKVVLVERKVKEERGMLTERVEIKLLKPRSIQVSREPERKRGRRLKEEDGKEEKDGEKE